MYETLVAWKYLFHPRYSPRVVAALIISLLLGVEGVFLYYLRPSGLMAVLLPSVPIWLMFAVTALTRLRRPTSELAGTLMEQAGILSLFMLSLMGMAFLLPHSKLAFLLPAAIPPALAVATCTAMVLSGRRKNLNVWMIRFLTLFVIGGAATIVRWNWHSVSVQYVGAGMIAGGAILTSIFALMCFFTVFTTISITGVILGATSLVMVRAVTLGFGHEFKDKVLGFNAHVLVMRQQYGFTDYKEVLARVRKMKHVTGAAPFTIAEMIVTYRKRNTTVLMKGVDPRRVEEVLDLLKYVKVRNRKELDAALDGLSQNLDKGLVGPGRPGTCHRFDEDGDPIEGAEKKCKLPGIMVGVGLARKLRLEPDSVIRLISPTAELAKFSEDDKGKDQARPLARDFRVVGTFYCGFEEYDQKMVFVHLKAAQHFVVPSIDDTDESSAVLGVEIKLDDIYAAASVAELIKKGFPEEKRKDYRIITWHQLNRPLFEALRTQKLIMTLIVFITVLVAAFGILAALTMLVLNKTKEIAILKAMGASSSGVSRIFQYAGVAVGMAGVGCGVSLGLLNCHFLSGLSFPLDPKVYLISRLPVMIDWTEVAVILAGGLLLCFFSTLYPAYKAAGFHPVEGLRYE